MMSLKHQVHHGSRQDLMTLLLSQTTNNPSYPDFCPGHALVKSDIRVQSFISTHSAVVFHVMNQITSAKLQKVSEKKMTKQISSP